MIRYACVIKNKTLYKYNLTLIRLCKGDAEIRSRKVLKKYTNNNICYVGAWAFGTIVVKALCYKSEGRGFETR
jgi:hypothetical protein